MIACGPNERRLEDAAYAPAFSEGPAEHVTQGLALGEAVIHDASLVNIVGRGLELRLDQRQNVRLRGDGSCNAGQDLSKADERDVNCGEVWDFRKRRQIADVRAFKRRHPRVPTECIGELAVADIDRVHVSRAAAEQYVGESAC